MGEPSRADPAGREALCGQPAGRDRERASNGRLIPQLTAAVRLRLTSAGHLAITGAPSVLLIGSACPSNRVLLYNLLRIWILLLFSPNLKK